MPPLYDLECLRQHPHLERRFTVSDCEDAQALGDRGWVLSGSIAGGSGGVHKPSRKRDRLSQRDIEG